jgi:hypothetical protein
MEILEQLEQQLVQILVHRWDINVELRLFVDKVLIVELAHQDNLVIQLESVLQLLLQLALLVK